MFNVGGGEMVMLGILALLVFGPEGLPGVIKSVMRTVRALRSAASDFQHEVKTALDDENVRQDQAKRRRAPMEPETPEPVPEPEMTPQLDVPDPAQPEEESEDEGLTLPSTEPVSENLDRENPAEDELGETTADAAEATVGPASELHPETKEFLYGDDEAVSKSLEQESPSESAPVEEEDDDDDGPGLPMRTAKERAKD